MPARRKQAVSDTCDPRLQALMQQTHTNSPLLNRPPEILDMILKYVLGDRMIHVKYLHRLELRDLGFDQPSNPRVQGVLYYAFCGAKKSEAEAYDEVRVCSGRVPADDDAEYYIASCKDRHSSCFVCKPGPMGGNIGIILNKPVSISRSTHLEHMVDLSVLGTCRELYRECHEIFWKTNTFSFNDPYSLTKFMAGRILVEKRKIQKIHICMEVSMDHKTWFRQPRESWRTKATIPRLTKPFNNLRVLHLSIDQHSVHSYHNHDIKTGMEPRLSHEDSQRVVVNQIESVLALRLLPLKQVTVVISDDETTRVSWVAERWTKNQKCELAEKFRGRLTDPHAAQAHEADMKAAKEEKQRATEKKGRAYIRKIQSDLDSAEIEAADAMDMYRELDESNKAEPGSASTGKNVGGQADKAKAVARSRRLLEKVDKLQDTVIQMEKNPRLAQSQYLPYPLFKEYYSD